MKSYPGIVEFGLDAYVVAFFLVLCSQDLEFGGAQRTVTIAESVD